MPQQHISQLMQLWARSLVDSDANPPFADCSDLHETIDSIELADVPWQSFTVSYNPEYLSDEDETTWKRFLRSAQNNQEPALFRCFQFFFWFVIVCFYTCSFRF
jgi:hypothetical protein